MDTLSHLIYCSAAAYEFSDADLAALLLKSRTNNATLGITGMLLYTERSFFQILEGERQKVEQLYKYIKTDHRHSKVVTIIQEPITRRAFDDWTMGYVGITPQEIAELTGWNDFFIGGGSFERLDGGRAKKLLAAFKEGRWHSKLSNYSPANNDNCSKPHMQPASMQKPQQ